MTTTLARLSVILLLAGAVSCSPAGPADNPTGNATGESPGLKTVGPVAEGPIQVGTWDPLVIDTPDWIFPMVYIIDSKPAMPADEYAMKFVEVIKTFPPERPVWLQSHRWMGDYKPGWDKNNVLAHIEDATPQGTPGIWPDEGKELWLKRQRTFLNILKKHGCRLDFWPLDHETTVQEWAHNWSAEGTFTNIVRDPRWRTEPIPGLGLRGIRIFDPAELDKEEKPWTRPGFDNVKDSRIACDAVTVAGTLMPETVLNEVFYRPIIEAYPHAAVSDYNKNRRPISGLVPLVDEDAEVPEPDSWDGRRLARMRPFWKKVHELKPELTMHPGVGNHASPSLYGGSKWRRNPMLYDYRKGDDSVDVMLRYVDKLIEIYGDPEKVAPWISLPNFTTTRHFDPKRNGQRSLTPEQYERLIIGLAERGVRKYILWFNPKTQNTPEANREFLEVMKKAYEVAKKRAGE